MLAALGQPWAGDKGMLPFPAKWWRNPELLPLVKKLEAWVDNRQASAERVWAVKDPRTTRFLPLWQEMLGTRGITPRYLLRCATRPKWSPRKSSAIASCRSTSIAFGCATTWKRFCTQAPISPASSYTANGLATGRRSCSAWLRSWVSNEPLMNVTPFSAVCCIPNCVGNRVAGAVAELGVHLYARLESLSDQQNLKSVPGFATEAEYFDAMLRCGEEPDTEGALTAVLTSTDGLPEAVTLAQASAGRRRTCHFERRRKRPTVNTYGNTSLRRYFRKYRWRGCRCPSN